MEMKINSLEQDVLYTIAYFGAMKYPLTIFELWRFFISRKKKAVSYGEMLELLKRDSLKKLLSMKKGFLVLKGDEQDIESRLNRHKMSMTNIKKIKRWSFVFRFIPFVRGVFVTGTLSMKNARAQSDWDILLVLAKNRIWIGRLFVGTILHLLGKRRHGKNVERRFCLNHYITENGLILEEHGKYCAYFTTFSLPVIGGTIHKRFLQLNEHWVRSQFPNYEKETITQSDIIDMPEKLSIFQKITESMLEVSKLAEILNNFAKKIMIKKIKSNPKTHLKNSDIRYSDCALVFLPKPHRIEIARYAKEKLANQNICAGFY